jgi:uracil phosphoribosyltransferase
MLAEVRSRCLRTLFSYLRDKETSSRDYQHYADRVIRLLVEESLSYVPTTSRQIEVAPAGRLLEGTFLRANISSVAIDRGGMAMLETFRALCPTKSTGYLLMSTGEVSLHELPVVELEQLPPKLDSNYIILLSDVMHTGKGEQVAIKVVSSSLSSLIDSEVDACGGRRRGVTYHSLDSVDESRGSAKSLHTLSMYV